MNLLPTDILTKIYEYDPTFRTYMTSHVLPYIHKYTSYKSINILTKKTVFLIINCNWDVYYVTDSLTNPSYISINYEELRNKFWFHFGDQQKYYSEKILLKYEQILFLANYTFLKKKAEI